MGRTSKGLSYFWRDFDLSRDHKIKKVTRRFGGVAIAVFEELLAIIDQTGSYYLEWDNEYLEDVNENLNERDIDKIREIFEMFLEVGLFHKGIFEKDQVLTSRGIQERFRDRISETRHKNFKPDKYSLLNAEDESEEEDNRELSEISGDFRKKSEKSGNNRELSENIGNKRKKAQESKSKSKSKSNIYPPPTPPLGGDVGVEEGFDYASPLGNGLTPEENEVIQTWNETFPENDGSKRFISGPPFSVNGLFRDNLHRAFKEGLSLTDFKTAFRTLKESPTFNWQLHSAVKPENVRSLLTQNHNNKTRAAPRTAPVFTREDYLEDGWD